ncbi:HAMP domain-containing protein [Paenibacillus albicereus]|uniref:HAMP domain-containing protein n=1 Tax=Paenibacillus albicereus TaxID=2726185 RepID=A0A6H2GZG7_9BACL|nr:methyl-accepting chemotaxis protein [Paenibacillus albicereus]QJC52831.1 HAMP domain-containing protein [Paenibacillus albicereus]
MNSFRTKRFLQPFRLISVKLFLIIFVSIVACVIAMGFLSYGIAKSIVERKVTEATVETAHQVRQRLDIALDDYLRFSMQFLTDKIVQDSVGELMFAQGEEDAFTRFKSQRTLYDRIVSMVMANKTVRHISFIPIDDRLETGVVGTGSIQTEDVQGEAWLQEAIGRDGQTYWTPYQPEGFGGGGQPSIGLARVIKSISGDPAYLMLLELEADAIRSQLDGISLGVGGEISLVDAYGVVLSDSNGGRTVGQPSPLQLKGSEVPVHYWIGSQLTIEDRLENSPWTVAAWVPGEELVRDARVIYVMAVWVAVGAALLAVLVGAFVVWRVARPLRQLQGLMQQGKDGRLSVRSRHRSKDEIGQLAASFNGMMEQLGRLVGDTRGSAAELLDTAGRMADQSRRTASSAREIAAATDEIAAGASSLAVEAEKGAELSERMDEGMQRMKVSTEEMRTSAVQVETASLQGTGHMAEMLSKTEEADRIVGDISAKIALLSDQMRSIRGILALLSGIAKQTNILSLNASIEAARAGEAGKGFIVVAGEVRELADQSKASILQVEAILSALQAEVAETVETLETARPAFREQLDSVQEANSLFHAAQSRMELLTDSLARVDEAIAELGISQLQIGEAMTSVSSVSEQSAAASQQVASLSGEQLGVSDSLVGLSARLEEVASSLRASLERFRLEQEAGASSDGQG